ncbi:MAG: hypothetical protein IKX70_06120 [Treponema sp.]|nr:hypothetical protein [Treponema sp.]
MKNKILPILPVVIIFMLFIPLPAVVIYVLFGLDVAALLFCTGCKLFMNIKNKQLEWFSSFAFFWNLFTLGVLIALTRIILSQRNPDNVNKVTNLIFSNETTITETIIDVIVFLCLTTAGLLINSSEKKRIKTIWEEIKQKGIKEDMEFYSSMDGVIKFAHGTFTAILFITVVIFLGGTLIDNLQFGKPIITCIAGNLKQAIGISIIFQALVLFFTFLCVTCFYKVQENYMREE